MLSAATRNILQLGTGFALMFFAFNTQGFIEEAIIDSASNQTIHESTGDYVNKHAGYYSLAIIYAVYTLATFFASPIAETLGPKWTMVLGGSTYFLFEIGFLRLTEAYLFISSAVLGIGAALIWTGQGTYLARNCTKETAGRNSSILWAMQQGSLILGGLFLFLVFHSKPSVGDGGISASTTRLLYAVFSALSIAGCCVLALLPMKPDLRETRETPPSVGELMTSTFKLLPTTDMLLFAVVFVYSGIEQTYWSGVYPTCIAFTKKLGSNTNSLTALNEIAAGFGQALVGGVLIVAGDNVRKVGRTSVVAFAFVVHLIAFALSYINIPYNAPLKKTSDIPLIYPNVPIALFTGFLLGMGDAAWNTQIYSLLVSGWPGQSSQAFALLKFYQSGLACAAFFYSSALGLKWELLIMLVFSVLAVICYAMVDKRRVKYLESIESARTVEDGTDNPAIDAWGEVEKL